MNPLSTYCRGVNKYQSHFDVYLKYMILWLYYEYGTTMLVIIYGPYSTFTEPAAGALSKEVSPLDSLPRRGVRDEQAQGHASHVKMLRRPCYAAIVATKSPMSIPKRAL